MKFIFPSRIALIASVLFGVPAFAFAQSTVQTTSSSLNNLAQLVLNVINFDIVPVIFAVAFVLFLIGIFRYFIQGGGNAEKTTEGRKFLMWSLVGFFVMFTVWGLVNLLIGLIPGLTGQSNPQLPGFNNTSSSLGTSISSILGGSSGSTILPSNVVSQGLFGCPSGTTSVPGTSNCITNGSSYTTNGVTYTASPNGTISQSNANANNGGTVGQGGSCEDNAEACQNGYVCQVNPNGNDTCVTASSNTGQVACDVGSVAAGQACARCSDGSTADTSADCPGVTAGTGQNCSTNDSICQNGTICSSTGTCVAIPGDGTVAQGGSCLGNENACANSNDTCDDNDVCSPDSNVNNGNTTVSCNDGTTQDADVGCGDDCGQSGSTNTCNDSSSQSSSFDPNSVEIVECYDGTYADQCSDCDDYAGSGC